jgi:transposase-like protein
MNCRKCNATHVIKNGKSRSGIQTYKCKICGYIWEDKELWQPFKNEEKILCHRCFSDNLRKEGKTTDKRQRYLCKDCGYKFAENAKYATPYYTPRPLTAEDKKLIVMYHIGAKVPIRDVARHINKPHEAVRLFAKNYKISHGLAS